MAICNSWETLLQEATGIRRGRKYSVAKNLIKIRTVYTSSLGVRFFFRYKAFFQYLHPAGIAYLHWLSVVALEDLHSGNLTPIN